MRNSNGHVVVPNVVRVGADEAINISVKDVSLDQLVDHRLKTDPKSSSSSISASTSMASLRTEMDALKNARAVKLEEMTNLQDNMSRLQALEVELKTINYNRMTLSQQLNRFKDQQKSDSRTFDAARRRYRAEVLMEADIICATLSGAGHEVLENLEFEMVIIDEAAQSIELSSLIPLKYPSRRCIMVGGSVLRDWSSFAKLLTVPYSRSAATTSHSTITACQQVWIRSIVIRPAPKKSTRSSTLAEVKTQPKHPGRSLTFLTTVFNIECTRTLADYPANSFMTNACLMDQVWLKKQHKFGTPILCSGATNLSMWQAGASSQHIAAILSSITPNVKSRSPSTTELKRSFQMSTSIFVSVLSRCIAHN